ncbi:MAG: CapA family protein [Spirochaetaceae bacterium]|nr:CapA family protein [Spirochaetaceae bacterium]
MTRFPEKLLLSTIVAVAALIVPKQAGGQTLGFVGDVMIHSSQLRRAWLGEDDRGVDSGYDFTPTFEWFAPYLLTPDLMLGNLETTFGGPNSALVTDEKYAFREYQAYPTFTTPDSLASALKAAGFDVMVTANNHSMDSGLGGAARTLTVLKEEGLEATGTSRSGRPVPWRGRVGDFNLSVLAWTASVNGLIASRGMEAINVFNARGHDGRLEEMLNDIRAEAERQPDLVILFIHWGHEYMEEPDQYQKNLAVLAVDAGADVIIGSHPHVLQPIERRIVRRDGEPDNPREVFIAWSMGNFVSSQKHRDNSREWVDGSMLLNLELGRDNTGRARVSAATGVPLYVRWSSENIRVLAVADGLTDGGRDRYGLSDYDIDRMTALEAWVPGQFTRYLGSLPARRVGAGWRVEFPSMNR